MSLSAATRLSSGLRFSPRRTGSAERAAAGEVGRGKVVSACRAVPKVAGVTLRAAGRASSSSRSCDSARSSNRSRLCWPFSEVVVRFAMSVLSSFESGTSTESS